MLPDEYPEFGLHGRGGQLYGWYGIGQSLLMLPADVLGTGLARLSMIAGYDDDRSVRSIVVSYITNILVNVLTALISFRLLRQLRFTTQTGLPGAGPPLCAPLPCTTPRT